MSEEDMSRKKWIQQVEGLSGPQLHLARRLEAAGISTFSNAVRVLASGVDIVDWKRRLAAWDRAMEKKRSSDDGNG